MRCALLVALSVIPCPALAQQRQPLEGERLERIASRLSEGVADIDSPQIEIQPDVAHATGFTIRQDGVVCLPHDGLSEESVGRNARTETGSAVGYLFTSENFVPLLNGAPVEASQLRIISLTDDAGNERRIKCLLLAVRRVSEDDWRLYVYGSAEQPLIDSKFESAAATTATSPISLNVDDVVDNEGTLQVTVFGKYRAGMRLRYEGN